ncbi:MAG TPA: uracil-DNA glycosylase family protein [Noviherbaspirillum sp.]|jgi:uracil-DNA glycosylase|uniref:uracil-DNA glycosylase family protein n=1 Tax=Noviherbaspirillum sp. TaxID=1926288 RepID=UPI002DDD677A|nr:uracil-DNA glycosylase family protein [Noviherbaspirillum sp.]HEV2611425.1 uracil-DNA glycosylase family protein [Noviherbaspirillum sp.]
MPDLLRPLLIEIAACRQCAAHLPHGPRPVVQAGRHARLLIVGQAPGRRVHDTGIPWNDPSGNRLRDWLAMPPDIFYDPKVVAIMPTAFCYPGKGKSGDLPPRPECAPLWHDRVLAAMPDVRLTLLVGRHAQERFLQHNAKATLTETVAAWRDYLPAYLPLPHPSPRNQSWWKSNPWFETDVLPALRERVKSIIAS